MNCWLPRWLRAPPLPYECILTGKNTLLEQIEVTVSVEWNMSNNMTGMLKTPHFTGNLQPEEIHKLRHIAGKCPTHKALLTPIEIKTELIYRQSLRSLFPCS